jgi:hypothetical protein
MLVTLQQEDRHEEGDYVKAEGRSFLFLPFCSP